MQSFCNQPFFSIPQSVLAADVGLGLNVVIKRQADATPEIYFTAAQAPSRDQIRQVAGLPGCELYALAEDRPKFQTYLSNHWYTLVHDTYWEKPQRLRVLAEVVRELLRDEFAAGDIPHLVEVARQLSQSLVTVLSEHRYSISELYAVLQHDYATFTHSTNVAIYCVVLAQELGLGEPELRDLATGALLHNIGQIELDPNLLNKPGGLTKTQYREIKRHPILGFSALIEQDGLLFGQLMMAYQHHERLDGSGYPSQALGDEIHDWAKLCAIVDAYEALISHRPYRDPVKPQEAMHDLQHGRGTEFEPEMLDCMRTLTCQLQ